MITEGSPEYLDSLSYVLKLSPIVHMTYRKRALAVDSQVLFLFNMTKLSETIPYSCDKPEAWLHHISVIHIVFVEEVVCLYIPLGGG